MERCDVADLINFRQSGEEIETKSCDGVSEFNAKRKVAKVNGAVEWVILHGIGEHQFGGWVLTRILENCERVLVNWSKGTQMP